MEQNELENYASGPDDIMPLAKKRFPIASGYWNEIYTVPRADTRFFSGEQWPSATKASREQHGRPCDVENRVEVFVDQIVNDSRRSIPSTGIKAADGGTPEMAELISRRFRQIEYETDASVAYAATAKQQIVAGVAYLRLGTEYKPGTFLQRLTLKACANPFLVYPDPAAKEPDLSDADYCFEETWMRESEYKREFGDTGQALASMDSDKSGWAKPGMVRVCDYYWRKPVKVTLIESPDMEVIGPDGEAQVIPGKIEEIPGEMSDDVELPEGFQRRCETRYKVYHSVIDGWEEKRRTELIDERIPIFNVFGSVFQVEDKITLHGLIRNAISSQITVNLTEANIKERIQMMPLSPWLMAAGQQAGYEKMYQEANTAPMAYMLYNATTPDTGSAVLPPPQRQPYDAQIGELMAAKASAVDAMKATMGMPDASLGNPSNETSGKAINARRAEADATNYHFIANQLTTRRSIGKAMLRMLDRIERGVKKWTVRKAEGDESEVIDIPEGLPPIGGDRYDVIVTAGPASESQRSQTFDAMVEMAQVYPDLVKIGGDILFDSLDTTWGTKLAERLRKTLPPELKDGEEQQLPPQVMEAMKAMEEKQQQLMAALQEAAQKLESKQIEAESRVRVAEVNADAKRDTAIIDAMKDMLTAQAQQFEQMLAQNPQLVSGPGALDESLEPEYTTDQV